VEAFSPQLLLTAAVLGLGPPRGSPSVGSPCANTWFLWPHSGSQWDSSDAHLHSRHPGWSDRGEKVGKRQDLTLSHTQPRVRSGTDLAVGTASPVPLAISAAGLVIMAEVPCPTRHIPHTLTGAEGQVGSRMGRVHLLLTGSGLHVARVPSWAAVLAILTAHGLG
jgi:hypothetical protein